MLGGMPLRLLFGVEVGILPSFLIQCVEGERMTSFSAAPTYEREEFSQLRMVLMN